MHINKINYNDTANIPQAQLVRNLPGSLPVDLHNRFFQIVFSAVTAAVHVYDSHGLSMIDDQVASAGKFNPPVSQGSQRIPQAKTGKHIFPVVPQLDFRIFCIFHLCQQGLYPLERFRIIHHDFFYIPGKIIPHHAH